MTDNEAFIVQSAIPDRLYVKTYHDFLDSTIINGKEKLIFILLKRYLNFGDDKSGISGTVYPTLNTLSIQAGMTTKTVSEIIKKLESKGLIEVKQQGLNQPNIYTIRDFKEIWKAKTDEEIKNIIELYEEEYEDSRIIEHLRNKGYTVIKEKELGALHTDQSSNEPSNKNKKSYIVDTTMDSSKSQYEERYSLTQIKEYFDYNVMLNDHQYQQANIDSVMNILHTALNTTKPVIRIGGEDKPSMVVCGKLMKLTYHGIMYAIHKYEEQTERIKNPMAYMLTLLYNAEEQMNLDVTNRVSHDMSNWNQNTDEEK